MKKSVSKKSRSRRRAARLRSAERERFLKAEWPAVRARMERLGLVAADLLAEA